jgi:uncharacterized SAM-binding protein YcdF (DUF218 family)
LIIPASLGLIILLAFSYLCFEIDRHGHRDLAQPADAIVVLGALVLPNGQPGPDLVVRTQHAVDLYRAGLAPYLLCSGGIRGDRTSAAAVSRAFAISLGVPEELIFLADGSANTEEDARQVATVMTERGWRTAIIVSHPLHVYRARLFFERQGLTAYTSPTTTDVDRIDLPWRAYYAIREGVGILWPFLEKTGLPPAWTATLQDFIYMWS